MMSEEKESIRIPSEEETLRSINRRSRSRSRGRKRHSVSSSDRSESFLGRHESSKKERPQKFMLKVIFTPLKRILKSPALKEMGINMDSYFAARGEPLGGHRTPADIELILWYVEQKYLKEAGVFERFKEFLLSNRKGLEDYGEEAYGHKYSPKWLEEYRKNLNTIFKAIQTPGNSNARFQNLYSRRPSEQSFINLKELKESFYARGVIPRPQEQ